MGSACQCGKALHVDSEQVGDDVGFGVAQLRERRGDVLDRAMALAQLQPGESSALTDRPDAGSETFFAQRLRQRLGAGGDVIAGSVHCWLQLRAQGSHLVFGEVGHGIGTCAVCQVVQGSGRDVLVGVAELGLAAIGQNVGTSGATTSAAGRARQFVFNDGVVIGQGVKVSADGGGREVEDVSQGSCSDRSTGAHGSAHLVPRAGFGGRGTLLGTLSQKHHISVTYMHSHSNVGMPKHCSAGKRTYRVRVPTSTPPSATPASGPTDGLAVEFVGVSRTFGSVRALDGVSWGAAAGQVTCVLGPNGAGKSTSMEIATGLQRPDSGSVRVLHTEPWHADAEHRARVGVMLQDGGLPQAARPLALIAHLSALYADPWPIADLCHVLGIDEFGKTSVRRLSGGQRRRLALAAALVGRPDVLFLDEPSAGLDPHARRVTHRMVREAADRGAAVVLSTHAFEEAERLAERVVILAHGQVVADGSVDEIRDGASLEDRYFALTDEETR